MTQEEAFKQGKVPDPLPDGFLKGSAGKYQGGWQGKEFNRKDSTGINIFNAGGKKERKYPFKTYIGESLLVKGLKVLKIDYNLPENAFWVRWILDEIVETSSNHYLGKIHLRFLGIKFALGYFKLEKITSA